jgi:tetratricopeptide (TPR) repeat protein
METEEASQLLPGPIMHSRLSPNGSWIAFGLEPSFDEIWVTDTKSLGAGRTPEEYYQEQIDRLTDRIELDPEDANNYHSRALFNSYLGHIENTLGDLEKYARVVDVSPAVAQAYGHVAWSAVWRHQEIGNPEIAVELSRRAHECQPKNWGYLCSLGAAYYRVGKYQEAITELKRSTELAGGDNAASYFLLAMARWQSGNQVSAIDWYNKAIEWIEDSDNKWYGDAWMRIYEAYLEASELMGLELREF